MSDTQGQSRTGGETGKPMIGIDDLFFYYPLALTEFIGKIFTFLNDSYHRDIGTPESLQTAEREYPWHPAA